MLYLPCITFKTKKYMEKKVHLFYNILKITTYVLCCSEIPYGLSKRPSFLARILILLLDDVPCLELEASGESTRVTILSGWASVLKTHSSKGITEGGENKRYKYFSVSARKKLCIILSFTPVFTCKNKHNKIKVVYNINPSVIN